MPSRVDCPSRTVVIDGHSYQLIRGHGGPFSVMNGLSGRVLHIGGVVPLEQVGRLDAGGLSQRCSAIARSSRMRWAARASLCT